MEIWIWKDLVAGEEAQVNVSVPSAAAAADPAVCVCSRARHCAITHAPRNLLGSTPPLGKKSFNFDAEATLFSRQVMTSRGAPGVGDP